MPWARAIRFVRLAKTTRGNARALSLVMHEYLRTLSVRPDGARACVGDREAEMSCTQPNTGWAVGGITDRRAAGVGAGGDRAGLW